MGPRDLLSDYAQNDDRDHDGLSDAQELALGSNLNLADTDGDKLTDSQEYSLGTDSPARTRTVTGTAIMWKSWLRPTRWTRNSKPSGYALTVTKTGTGSGTVTSSPAGINCGATCSAKFTSGVTVTLAATPAAGSTFVGWSGACTGTGACTVSMTASKTVTATFNTTTAGTYALTLYKIGTGLGTVASNPAGINCGTGCVANFTSGRLVTLTATPTTGSTFTGWGGACAGTARTCTVTMSAARVVTATFNAPC